MTVATRIDHLERERFAEACRAFRPWFLEHLRDPDTERRERAWLVAAGMPVGGTRAELRAWFDAQPRTPAERAWDEAVDPVMELLMEHPAEHVAIRAALARLAPHLGRRAGDAPLVILAALRAGFDGT